MNISKRNKNSKTAEVDTDPTVEAETIQETTTEITTGMVVEITTTEIEVETVETTVEIEIEAEEETDLIPEKEEEINLDLDQVKDILIEMTSGIIAIELVIQHITALELRNI